MAIRGRDKTVLKELIALAIQNGKVKDDKIEFRIRDIGIDKIREMGAFKFCTKRSKKVFGVRKDGTSYVYEINYEIVKCYGDDNLVELFKKKLKKG